MVAPSDTQSDAGYPVNPTDNITLLASKIMRDVLVTRAEPMRRRELWQAVELAMGERSPDVDGVLKGSWFDHPSYGKWGLTDDAQARESPFTDAQGVINVAMIVEYLRRCRGEPPYIRIVSEFINVCQPKLDVDPEWIMQTGRSVAGG
jgi:hypothetical protein